MSSSFAVRDHPPWEAGVDQERERKEVCLQPLGRTHSEWGARVGHAAEAWTAQDSSGRGLRLLFLVLLVEAWPDCPVWGPRGCGVAGLPALGVLLCWARGAWWTAGVTSRHLRPEGEPRPSEPLSRRSSSFS